jgi:hypothetical protein
MTKKEVIGELKKLQKKLGSNFNRDLIRNENSKLDYWIREHFITYTNAYRAIGIVSNVDEQVHIADFNKLDVPPKRIIRDYEWLGRAAEYYVMAELLYQGYNATRLTMDTGKIYLLSKKIKLSISSKKHLV